MPTTFVQPTQLLEVVQSSAEVRVDREAGIIRGVRVLGPTSSNRRIYAPQAITSAKPLYEGIHVNYDHPPKGSPDQERRFGDRAGWLTNVREHAGGLSGDLNVLKSDPRAEKVFEAAERRPESFGLSHNAEGRITKQDGKNVVEEITRVRSVDLVADPATTRSLFESIERENGEPPEESGDIKMSKTMKQIADAHHATNKRAAALKRFLEQEGMPMADVPVDAPAADPNAEIAAAFEKAAMSILKKVFVGEMDVDEGCGKIKELLGKKEEVVADAGAAVDAVAPAPESVQADMARLRAEISIRDQLQESGVKSTPARVKAMIPLTESERKELIDSWKGQATTDQRGDRPASSPLREQDRQTKLPEDAKSFAEALFD